MPATFYRLPVAAVERITDDAVVITFDVPAALREDYVFRPGQHLNIRWSGDGQDVRRTYSICSRAGSGRLRIAVKRLPGGLFSAYAAERLRPGDELEVMTPTGSFHTDLDPAARRHYAAIAAGSGIAPVLSILETTLADEPGSSATLLYGNRTTASIMFADELAELKDRYPDRLTLVHVLSREPREVELLSGRLDQAKLERFLATLLPAAAVDEWFLCGPYAMVTELRATLLDHGVGAGRVHLELFHAGDAPAAALATAPARGPEAAGGGRGAAAERSSVTVILDGRASTFELAPKAEPILDAVLRVRPDAPYACKGGVCGTCRARLREGEVRMERNYALEGSELDTGMVLTCQSHPASPTVILDFDV